MIAVGLLWAASGASQEPTPPTTGPETPPTVVVVRAEGGFHWLDAGLGAVAALAALALAYGLTLAVRREGWVNEKRR